MDISSNAKAPVAQLVRASDRHSEDPGSNPGWISWSFFTKCLMMSQNVSWCLMVAHDVSTYLMVSNGVSLWLMMSQNVLLSYGVSWWLKM